MAAPTLFGMTVSSTGSAPPGWYPDPSRPAALRWWDGARWTEHCSATWNPPVGHAGAPGFAASDQDLRYVLPVNRDGFAIASGYLGVLSLLPNPLTSGAAIVCGVIALQRIRASRQLGRGRAWFGIVIGVISAAVFSFVLIAAPRTPSAAPLHLSRPSIARGRDVPEPSMPTGADVTAPATVDTAAIAQQNLTLAAAVVHRVMSNHSGTPITREQLRAADSAFSWDLPDIPIGGPGSPGSAVISTGVTEAAGALQRVMLALPGNGVCYYVSITEGAADRYGVARDASGCFVTQTPPGDPAARPDTTWSTRWPAPGG